MKTFRFMALVGAAVAPLIVAMPASAGVPAPTAVSKGAAHQYLVDSAPVDRASTAFQSTVISWMGNPNVTGPQAEATARPLISALVTFQDQLRARPGPRARGTIFVRSRPPSTGYLATCGRSPTTTLRIPHRGRGRS